MIDLLKNRKAQIAAQAVVITGLVGGTGAVLTMNKPVTLEVNGQSEQIRTFGGTVGEILDNQNIDLQERDQVKPGVDAKIDRNMTVTVNTAKDVSLTVDGTKTEEWTTANTVGQALADLGVDAKGAELSAGAEEKLKTSGATNIDVTTAKSLTVVADGKDYNVAAAVGTAGDALAEAKVTLDQDDFLSVPMSAAVTDGQVLTVNRVENDTVTQTEEIKPQVETKKSSSLYVGETKVETAGKAGQKEVQYAVRTVNGDEVEKEKKSEKVLSEAQAKVVLEGTKERESTPSSSDSSSSSSSSSDSSGSSSSGSSGSSSDDSSSSSSGSSSSGSSSGGSMSTSAIQDMLASAPNGSTWTRIAKCESNFNPKAVNPAGYYGLFQFAPATWRSLGGTGLPHEASPQTQFDMAQKLQQRSGWSQWSCY